MKEEKSSKEANIIAVSNQKGGEGKTTISLFLSEALSEHFKVLLIDWDAQANATRLFVNNPEKSIFHCLKYRNNSPISMNVITKHITENFHLIPSSISLANLTTPFDIEDFELLKDAIEPLKPLYDYIIIDCPPSLGLVLENALIAADYVIIPVQTRAFSVQGLQDLYNSIEKIKKRANPNLKLLGAILNQYEESRALSGLSKNIRKYFPVFKTIIYRKENIPQAQAKRKLLKGCDPKTRKNFYELANEIQEHINVEKK
ncbi:MAG: ParA family protein [Leptospiraceae bacterium]|nr:ParA family protein [Leptospiraceae bacterium]MCP5496758.1 ParA family protein [Leptospiraceae bacterium]